MKTKEFTSGMHHRLLLLKPSCDNVPDNVTDYHIYACVLYFCICTCSAQLSMFHMERHSRNRLIVIIIIINVCVWYARSIISLMCSLQGDMWLQKRQVRGYQWAAGGHWGAACACQDLHGHLWKPSHEQRVLWPQRLLQVNQAKCFDQRVSADNSTKTYMAIFENPALNRVFFFPQRLLQVN